MDLNVTMLLGSVFCLAPVVVLSYPLNGSHVAALGANTRNKATSSTPNRWQM